MMTYCMSNMVVQRNAEEAMQSVVSPEILSTSKFLNKERLIRKSRSLEWSCQELSSTPRRHSISFKMGLDLNKVILF